MVRDNRDRLDARLITELRLLRRTLEHTNEALDELGRVIDQATGDDDAEPGDLVLLEQPPAPSTSAPFTRPRPSAPVDG